MLKTQHFFRALLVPMAIFLPAWVTFAHGGWITIVYIFTLAPFLLVSLLIISFLIRRRPDVKQSGNVSVADVWLLGSLYLSLIVYGSVVVDGGDTPESINSLSMSIFGRGFQPIAELLSPVLAYVSAALLAITFVFVIVELIQKRR